MSKVTKIISLISIFSTAFYSTALWAQEATGAAKPQPPVSSFMMQLPMIGLFFALFYFIAIAPQRKQAKLQQDFQKSISKGDEVVTASGIIGTVAGLTDRVVTLEVAPGTELRILRTQVQAKLKELQLSGVKS